MRVFITGATGFIGQKLAAALLAEGHQVRALVRDVKRLPIAHENLITISGDLSDKNALLQAMKGCDLVFHMAAFAAVWEQYPGQYFEINVKGTDHVLGAALDAGVKKVVYTSTAGVLGPSTGEPIHEQSVRTIDFFNAYESSKALAEKVALRYALKGLDVSILMVSRVFGEGPLNDSNATTKLILQTASGKWRMMPGDGSSIGNYVWVDDVVQAHLLAARAGGRGERYIIGGENLSFEQFFTRIKNAGGAAQSFLKVPVGVIMAMAHAQEFSAKNFKTYPKITPSWARRYLYHWPLSIDKAKDELGYNPASFDEAVHKTIEWGLKK